MILYVTIALVLLFVFFVQKTMVLRDIDRSDAKYDELEIDQRPKEYVPPRIRKRVLLVMYTITALLAGGLVAVIVSLWPS